MAGLSVGEAFSLWCFGRGVTPAQALLEAVDDDRAIPLRFNTAHMAHANGGAVYVLRFVFEPISNPVTEMEHEAHDVIFGGNGVFACYNEPEGVVSNIPVPEPITPPEAFALIQRWFGVNRGGCGYNIAKPAHGAFGVGWIRILEDDRGLGAMVSVHHVLE